MEYSLSMTFVPLGEPLEAILEIDINDEKIEGSVYFAPGKAWSFAPYEEGFSFDHLPAEFPVRIVPAGLSTFEPVQSEAKLRWGHGLWDVVYLHQVE